MNLKSLLSWSENEFSSLPWRKNRSLYRTLVSEIMLQQTTVGTVKNHYDRFLKQFPTLASLASATEDELTVAWKGLGYYRRARNLKKIAESIYRDHQGEFPQSLDDLLEIPGIGPYTANAILSIGMDKPALAVDANLERVIARLFRLQSQKGPALHKEIQNMFAANAIFNEKVSFRALNEALMDLGRTFCQARKVSCELCPLRKECASFEAGEPLRFPVAGGEPKKSQEHELHLLRVIVKKKNKLLVYRKAEGEWLSGQYEIPTFILTTTDKKLRQYPRLETWPEPDFSFSSGITKYKIKNSVIVLSEKEFRRLPFSSRLEWRCPDSADSNLTTATLKALAKVR